MVKVEQISMYLGEVLEVQDGQYRRLIKSPYFSLLQDARNITGRNDTGTIIDSQRTGNWLGAVAYLIVIDHIGGKFFLIDDKKEKRLDKLRQMLDGKELDFVKTLVYFSNISDEEIFTLYALRCALIHEYSLQNKSKNSYLNYDFSVTRGAGNLCTFYQDNSGMKKATVNLEELANLVERIHEKLLKYHQNDLLKTKEDFTFITYLKGV